MEQDSSNLVGTGILNQVLWYFDQVGSLVEVVSYS
jgi:hypothetical protein